MNYLAQQLLSTVTEKVLIMGSHTPTKHVLNNFLLYVQEKELVAARVAETKALLEKKVDTDKDCCKLNDEAKVDYESMYLDVCESMYLDVCGPLEFITTISSLLPHL